MSSNTKRHFTSKVYFRKFQNKNHNFYLLVHVCFTSLDCWIMICRLKAMSLLVYFLFHSYIIYKQINKQGIMVNVNVFYQLSSMRPNSNNVSFIGCWWMHGKIKKHVHCNSYAFSKWDKKKWKRMRSCSEALTSCGRNEVLFDLKK